MKYLENFHSVFNNIVEDAIISRPKPEGSVLMATQTLDCGPTGFLGFFPKVPLNGIQDRRGIKTLHCPQTSDRFRFKDNFEHRRFIL